jgi:hypothetical protein
MKAVAATVTLAVVAAIVAGTALATPVRTSCTAGVHPFGDVNARTFCGPARATLSLAGKTIRFSGGNCERGTAYLAINIGTVVLGTTTKPKPEYFGILVGKAPIVGGTAAAHDGTYKPQAFAFVHAHKGYAIFQSSVTLAGGRTRGTFSGKPLGSNAVVRGSFHC